MRAVGVSGLPELPIRRNLGLEQGAIWRMVVQHAKAKDGTSVKNMDQQAASLIVYVLRLLRPFWKMAVFATFMGGVNSFAAVLLLSIINRELHAEVPASITLVASFAALFFVLLASEIVSGVGNSFVGQNVIAEMRKDLAKKILSAPIAEIERFQPHRIITVLNQDVSSLSDFSRGLSYLVVSICEAAGCTAYLIYLSLPMFLVCAGVGASAWLVIRYVLISAYTNLSLERKTFDNLQKHYNALVDGAKELRVNRERRRRFHDGQLLVTIEHLRDLSNRSFLRFVTSGAIDNASFFLIAGALIALAPFMGAKLCRSLRFRGCPYVYESSGQPDRRHFADAQPGVRFLQDCRGIVRKIRQT